MTQLCATVADVRPLGGYRLEVAFSDGVRGVVDLANRIVGRGGVLAGRPQILSSRCREQ